jgi:hypothetical protein
MAISQLLGQTTFSSPSTASHGLDSADWIALGSLAVSIIALWVSVYFAWRTERTSKSANDIATGQAETNLRGAIAAAHQWVQQCNIQIATICKDKKPEKLTPEERSIFEALLASYDKAAEQLLNSYEDACAKFLDNKIDKERFKNSYDREIRDLCDKERGTIHKLLHPKNTSNYRAIWSVYEEWNSPNVNTGSMKDIEL